MHINVQTLVVTLKEEITCPYTFILHWVMATILDTNDIWCFPPPLHFLRYSVRFGHFCHARLSAICEHRCLQTVAPVGQEQRTLAAGFLGQVFEAVRLLLLVLLSNDAHNSAWPCPALPWRPAQGPGRRQTVRGPKQAPASRPQRRLQVSPRPRPLRRSPPPRAAGPCPEAVCRAAQPRVVLLTLCGSKAILSSKSLTRSGESGQCWRITHLTGGGGRGRNPQTLLRL